VISHWQKNYILILLLTQSERKVFYNPLKVKKRETKCQSSYISFPSFLRNQKAAPHSVFSEGKLVNCHGVTLLLIMPVASLPLSMHLSSSATMTA
jgi:hypothetical protein